mgnify:CR=1 FL=1
MALTHSPSLVTDGLVLCVDAANTKSYPGSGTTWKDISGKGANGTLTNGPTFDSGNKGSIAFDGTNDYVLNSTAGVLPDGTDLFTLSIWMYYDANPSGTFIPGSNGTVVFSGNSSGTIELIIRPDGTSGPPYKITFSRYGGSTTGLCSVEDINMPIQQWHNLVLVRSASDAQTIYLNSTSIVTGNVSNSFTSGSMHIGAAPSQSNYSGHFNGKIANVLKYNKALTATEVQQNYNALKGRFGL